MIITKEQIGEDMPVRKRGFPLGFFIKYQTKLPISTGMLRIKENSKARYFSIPVNIPAIVVIPDLDVPGMRATV